MLILRVPFFRDVGLVDGEVIVGSEGCGHEEDFFFFLDDDAADEDAALFCRGVHRFLSN